MRRRVLTVIAALLSASATASSVQVRITGTTRANKVLVADVLRHISVFGPKFNCLAPTTIETSAIAPWRIATSAAYRAPSEHAFYEEWIADFCGSSQNFLVSYWPDPNGGSFLKVTYPYPAAAPHGEQ
jgi:hypothetical protein